MLRKGEEERCSGCATSVRFGRVEAELERRCWTPANGIIAQSSFVIHAVIAIAIARCRLSLKGLSEMEDFGKWFFGESSNLTGSSLSRAAAFFAEGQGMRFRMELQILALQRDETRGDALRFLAAHREFHSKLAPMLWNIPNTVFVLIQEVFSAYPMLRTPFLTMAAAERASNALVLLKCVASHHDAKRSLVNAKIQEYLYPILRTTHRDRPHEKLRLQSLEVIDKLLEHVEDEEIVKGLAEARMVLYCLRCIVASHISTKEVAALILQRILMHEAGMNSCCFPIYRFVTMSHALTFVVEERDIVLSKLLLRRIASCFLSLSKHARAQEVLHNTLPMRLEDACIAKILEAEPLARDLLREAADNLTGGGRGHHRVEPRFGLIARPPGPRVRSYIKEAPESSASSSRFDGGSDLLLLVVVAVAAIPVCSSAARDSRDPPPPRSSPPRGGRSAASHRPMALGQTRACWPALLKLGLGIMAMCIAGYILGPPLYWHFREGLAAVSHSSPSACPACDCDCSSQPLLSIPEGLSNGSFA
ncbi:hypothetical protein NL676_017655, partial [Syzygium grande]